MIKPVAKTLYLCDNVLAGLAAGKVILVNLWDSVRVPSETPFPFTLDHLYAFAWWRDGEGEISTRIDIVDASDGALVFRSRDFQLSFARRGTSIWSSYRLERIVFPSPGHYFVELFALDEFVDDQVIRVFAA